MKTYSKTIIAGCKAREFNGLRGVYVPILSGEDIMSKGRLNGGLDLDREESLLLHQAMITGIESRELGHYSQFDSTRSKPVLGNLLTS